MAHATIKQGSTGEDVKAWQKILGVNVDGNFGANTKQATIDWQRKHNLVPDGVVGDVSWSTAEGKPIPKVKTSMAPADLNAYEVAKRAAPSMPENQRQYVIAVARGEGGFGLGWAHPSAATIAESQKYGLTGYEGAGSNNWGADQGTGTAGSFKHVDYGWKTENGQKVWKSYVGTYKKHARPEDGFLSMAKVILGGGKRGAAGAAEIKAAIDAGDLRKAVFAQHANGYFELDPEKYLSSVLKNYDVLTTNIEWKQAFGKAAGIAGKAFAVIGFLIVGSIAFLVGTKRIQL